MSYFLIFLSMGCGISSPAKANKQSNGSSSSVINKENSQRFKRIRDRFETFDQVYDGLKSVGFEVSNMILAVDFTASNRGGDRGKSLHRHIPGKRNPYERVMYALFNILTRFDDNANVPVYVFGDSHTKGHSVRLMSSKNPTTYNELETVYRKYRDSAIMSGPTSFSPIIKEAIRLCQSTRDSTGKYTHHTLMILTDGETVTIPQDAETIRSASNLPISIVCVGIGDAMKEGTRPREVMDSFDDNLTGRKFDNWQFNEFPIYEPDTPEKLAQEAADTLMEIPDQYLACKSLGYIY